MTRLWYVELTDAKEARARKAIVRRYVVVAATEAQARADALNDSNVIELRATMR